MLGRSRQSYLKIEEDVESPIGGSLPHYPWDHLEEFLLCFFVCLFLSLFVCLFVCFYSAYFFLSVKFFFKNPW